MVELLSAIYGFKIHLCFHNIAWTCIFLAAYVTLHTHLDSTAVCPLDYRHVTDVSLPKYPNRLSPFCLPLSESCTCNELLEILWHSFSSPTKDITFFTLVSCLHGAITWSFIIFRHYVILNAVEIRWLLRCLQYSGLVRPENDVNLKIVEIYYLFHQTLRLKSVYFWDPMKIKFVYGLKTLFL